MQPRVPDGRRAPAAASELDPGVEAVRRFNRFFTQRVGVLHEGLLESPFSLTEVRVMYELAHREGVTATELCQALDLDAGYVSRILRGFDRRGLTRRRRSPADGRQSHLSLTTKGKTTFAALDRRSHDDVAALLASIRGDGRRQLVSSMQAIERLLTPAEEPRVSYLLRPHRPGDMGWVVWRHGVQYFQEYGWNEHFEALTARIVADFVQRFDATRERCWIAERDGQNVGSVFLVRESEEAARLRLLLVEPEARGLGIGRRLVAECVSSARQLGYRRVTLWTNDVLHGARRLYERAGFRLVAQKPHRSYGHDLVGQDWDLEL